MPNPLQQDPTRTVMLRKKFVADMHRRFEGLRKAIDELVAQQDAFGLDQSAAQPGFQIVANRQFAYDTDPGKIKAFQKWLATQVAHGILGTEPGVDPKKPWTADYISSAYKQAAVRAYIQAKGTPMSGAAGFAEGSKAQFLSEAFGGPVGRAQLEMLSTRAFDQLKGITADMSGKMSGVLAGGFAHGDGPREIARKLKNEVTGIEKKRALVLARTEIIHAYSEGALDSFDRLGIEKLGVNVEWDTAGDDRVCPICASLSGQVFTNKQARGMIPKHPNCRCAWVPSFDEPTNKGKQEKKERMGKSIKAAAVQAPAAGLWNLSPAPVIRWMGKEGWSTAEARKVLDARGVQISDATIKTQLGVGRKGKEAVANLTPDQMEALRKLRGGEPGPVIPPPIIKPKPGPQPGDVIRGPTFADDGIYHVHTYEGTVRKIFRDPENGWWYEDKGDGSHYTTRVVGFTKEEAVAKVVGVKPEPVKPPVIPPPVTPPTPKPPEPVKPLPGQLTDLVEIKEGQQGQVFKAKLDGQDVSYKPNSGENQKKYEDTGFPNPGWKRELAASGLDDFGEFGVVPKAELVVGPKGPGLVKSWVNGTPLNIDDNDQKQTTLDQRTTHAVFSILVGDIDAAPPNTLITKSGPVNIDLGGAFATRKQIVTDGRHLSASAFGDAMTVEEAFQNKLSPGLVSKLNKIVSQRDAVTAMLSKNGLTSEQISDMFDRADALLKHKDDFRQFARAVRGEPSKLGGIADVLPEKKPEPPKPQPVVQPIVLPPPGPAPVRPAFDQHSATGVVRWLGKEGFNFQEAQRALREAGFNNVADATIRAQLLAGRKGQRGAPAALTEAQIAFLKANKSAPGPNAPALVAIPKPKPAVTPTTPAPKAVDKDTPPKGITFTGKVDDFTREVWERVREVQADTTNTPHKKVVSVGVLIQDEIQKHPTVAPLITRYQEISKEAASAYKAYTEATKKPANERTWEEKEEISRLWNTLAAKRRTEAAHKRDIQKVYSQATLDTISRVRDLAKKEHHPEFIGDSDLKDSAKRAIARMPADWAKDIQASMAIEMEKAGRGQFSRFGGKARSIKGGINAQILVDYQTGEEQDSTMLHELTHAYESARKNGLTNKKLHEAQTSFLNARRKPDEPLTEITKGEWGWKDDFIEHYMGRYYDIKDRKTGAARLTKDGGPEVQENLEILTMGMEEVLGNRKDNVFFRDPEYLRFILGTLVSL